MKPSGQKLNNILLSLVLILFVSISVAARQDEEATINTKRGVYKHTHIKGFNSFKIEFKGNIEVTDDDRDIKGISRGGYIDISKTTFGSKRRILIKTSSGGLERSYYEGRKRVAYEPSGREWLAEILPDIVRSTDIAAESRVNRFYRKGGVEGVLEEIERLDGSTIKAIYAKLLLKKDLNPNELVEAIEEIADEVSSDHYLASILQDHSQKYLQNDRTAYAFFEAIGEIGSDYYATVILKNTLKQYTPSNEEIVRILKATSNIGSDYYISAVLHQVLKNENLSGEVLDALIETAKTIGSDYYQSQILKKALDIEGVSGKNFDLIIEALAMVSSDYYMADVFQSLLNEDLANLEQAALLRLLHEHMKSDYYLAAVLSRALDEQELGGLALEELTKTIGEISSDYYAASVIIKAAKQDIEPSMLLSLITAAERIDSDYYLSSALISMAEAVKDSDEEVRKAYIEAANNIGSETYYRRALKAIN